MRTEAMRCNKLAAPKPASIAQNGNAVRNSRSQSYTATLGSEKRINGKSAFPTRSHRNVESLVLGTEYWVLGTGYRTPQPTPPSNSVTTGSVAANITHA